jgi:membrane-associated protein
MEHIIYLLSHYKYLMLFPLAIVEGPIITVIAGFLCAGGFLAPLPSGLIIVCGDVIGDSLYYALGRWGIPPFLRGVSKRLRLDEAQLARVGRYFGSNPARTISMSKVILGVGVTGLYLAGNAGIAYPKFLRICLITSALQCVLYFTIGVLFGHAYRQINEYLNYVAAIAIISALVLILLFTIRSMSKRL